MHNAKQQQYHASTYNDFLSLNNVVKRFNNKTVLHNINLQINKGEVIAIIGKSGCGKSTLLRLLAGLEKKSEGTITINRKKLSQEQDNVRLMFQNSRLLPWKRVLDNIGLGLSGNWQNDARQLLQIVGLKDKANEWPSALSGGQQQRIALARALIHQPQLLLLDEPLGALDALTRIEMQKLIEELWFKYQLTIIMVTHDVNEAVIMADKVILLEEGEISLSLDIPLPRPRLRGNREVARLEEFLLNKIMKPTMNKTFQIRSPRIA